MKWVTRERVHVERVACPWTWAPAASFLVAFGCGLLGTILFALLGRDLGPASPR